jgi:hypothetical protein
MMMSNPFRTNYPDFALLAVILVLVGFFGLLSWWVGAVLVFSLPFVLRRSYVFWCREQREKERQEWRQKQLQRVR